MCSCRRKNRNPTTATNKNSNGNTQSLVITMQAESTINLYTAIRYDEHEETNYDQNQSNLKLLV